MRENKFDIRRFNFTQLSQLTHLVAEHQKNDLHVFFKYILSCLDQDYYPKRVLTENFSSFSHLFHLFVSQGFIAPQYLTRFYYTYVLILKEKVERESIQAVSYNELVDVLWALIVTEESQLKNPLIPKLLERLHDFKRPEKPLTQNELLELYQIDVQVQEMVRSNRLPKEFKDVIP